MLQSHSFKFPESPHHAGTVGDFDGVKIPHGSYIYPNQTLIQVFVGTSVIDMQPGFPWCPAAWFAVQRYRGTSLIRKRTSPGPYRRPMPRFLGGSYEAGRFLMGEVPLYNSGPCTILGPPHAGRGVKSVTDERAPPSASTQLPSPSSATTWVRIQGLGCGVQDLRFPHLLLLLWNSQA